MPGNVMKIYFKIGSALSDMVLCMVKCPEKRDEFIKRLNKLKWKKSKKHKEI